MKKAELFVMLIAAIVITWFIKFVLHFPTADISVIGVILSISSILFGLLAGFFFSELWQRYTEIRSLQSERSSAGLMLITLATHFFKNKKFKKEFIQRMENTAIADETIIWDEGDFEEPYFNDVAKSFELVNVKGEKDSQYFGQMLDYSFIYSSATIKADVLYKERLTSIEWLLFTFLSFIIVISVLLLDTTQMLYRVIVLTFPGVIFLTLSIIYGLNMISWSRNLITLEPNEVIFDALELPRFYCERNRKFVPLTVKKYRTEKMLQGEARRVFEEVMTKREKK